MLAYREIPGGGAPLVFIHGLGCVSTMEYAGVAERPALAGRRMFLADLLGAGASAAPAGFAYTVEAHAECVAAWIGSLGLEDVDLFGHSAGGAVSIVAARLCPRVRRLVVAEPNLDPGGGVFSLRIAQYTEDEFADRGHKCLVRASRIEGNLRWAETLETCWPRAVHRLAVSLVRGSEPSWRAQLLSLRIPRTVVAGERSLPDPAAESLAAAGLPLRIVPAAGHSMAWENPRGLAETIRDALDPAA